MRLLPVAVVFFAASHGFAQTPAVAVSLKSLRFLTGIWTPDERERDSQTMEFHWENRQGRAVLVSRTWTGDEKGCPWCVTQAMMLAYYDDASNQAHIAFINKSRRTIVFTLASAAQKSVEFLTMEERGIPTYRLTYKLSSANQLLITLEKATPVGSYFPVAQWSLHRRSPFLFP